MIRRYAVPLGLASVVLLHLGLVLHFVPVHAVLGPEPLVGLDLDLHYQETLRAVEAFRESGRTWCYDPHLLAGQISGAIFDADNKLFELWVIALSGLGVPTHRAFNLFLWFAHLPLPLVVYGTGRLCGGQRPASVVAAGFASLLWFFDSFNHFIFYVGAICWASAAYLLLLPFGLFYRFTVTRRWRWLVLLAPALTLTLTMHPYTFFCLLTPMVWVYARVRRELQWRDHVAVWVVAAIAVAGNAWWLWPAIRFWHYTLDSGFFLDATPAYLLYDYLGILRKVDIQGVIAVRTGFRFAVFAAAGFGFYRWYQARDARYAPLLVTVAVLFVAAHVGRWLTPLQQVQPYRFIGPAMYLALFPAAGWLVHVIRSWRASRPSAAVAGLVAVLLFVAVSKLARDVLYFFPGWVPEPENSGPPLPNINQDPSYGAAVWPPPFEFRHQPIASFERPLVAFVNHYEDGRSRWLMEWQIAGERLAWASDAQIIGGFRVINLAHSDANLFRRFPTGIPDDPDELRSYLERYNVGWVVLTFPFPELERRTDLLEFVADLGHRIYRTRIEPSWFLDGGPGTVEARIDRLTIRGSRGGDLVLKYHYLETLQCRPDCELYQAPIPFDRVGFIGVRHAPTDFEIVNP